MTRDRLPPATVYMVARGVDALAFALFATLASVRRVVDVGLDPLQLVLVGTVLETTVVLFEVPTGIVADVYGRRLSVVIGQVLMGLGFLLESVSWHFMSVLSAQVVWGIGVTFISGAREAWVADEVEAARVAPVYLRGAQAEQLGALAGIAVAVGLGGIALALPLRVGGACAVALAVFLMLTMPERGFRPGHHAVEHAWRTFALTLRDGVRAVRDQPTLRAIVAIAVFYGMASEGMDRLWEFHFLNDLGFPAAQGSRLVLWFGTIRAVALLASMAAIEFMRRRVRVDDARVATRTLCRLTAAVVAAVVMFGLAPSLAVGVTAYLTLAVCRRVIDPLFDTWTNRQLTASTRATVLSIRNQGGAFGEIMGGPLLGGVATALTVRAALVGAGLLLCPALAVYGRVPPPAPDHGAPSPGS